MIKGQAANAAAGQKMTAALTAYSKMATASTDSTYMRTVSTRLRSELSEAFELYVDAKARARPKSFHHAYEWGEVGSPSGRLFKVTGQNHGSSGFTLGYKMLPSSSPVPGGNHVFQMKASIMEDQVTVVIRPVNARVLVFDLNGRTVFTPGPVTVTTPGGRAVAGALGSAFSNYFIASSINKNPIYTNIMENAKTTINKRIERAAHG
jgi:hypothetical protein